MNSKNIKYLISILIIISSLVLLGCQRTPSDENASYDHYVKAEEYLNERRYSSALEEYKLSINADPSNTQSYLKAAEILILKNNFDEAIEILSNGEETATNPSQIFEKKAEIYFLKKDYENSSTSSQNALKKDEKNWNAQEILTKSLDALGDKDKAVESLEDFSSDDSQATAMKEFYLALLKYDVIETALGHINKAEADAESNLADKIKDYKEVLIQATEKKDDEIKNSTNIAYQLIKNEFYGTSIIVLSDLIEIDNEYWGIQLYLGISYYNLEQYDKAIESLKEASLLTQTDYEPWYYLGLSYEKLNNQTDMKSSFETAINISKQDEMVIYDYVKALISQENYSKASDEYETLIEMKTKNYGQYKIELGYIEMDRLVDYENSKKIAVELIEQWEGFESLTNTQKAQIYDIYGWSLIQLDQDGGIDYLQQSIEFDPYLSNSYYHLGLIYIKQGKYAEARGELEKSIDFDLEGEVTQKALVELNKI